MDATTFLTESSVGHTVGSGIDIFGVLVGNLFTNISVSFLFIGFGDIDTNIVGEV